MATFSFGVVPGAPGTYINERAGNVASAGISSFNTVYMLVETEENVSVTRFPFNKPIPLSSVEDYKSLVGGIPDSGIPLLSYNCVNAFYSNAQVGDLRVVRVGTPNQIVEIEVLPSATKFDSTGIPSPLQAGDNVYVQMTLNGLRLVSGDGTTGFTADGEWLGVPVTIPVDYISGDPVNNRKISSAIANAIALAIETNPSVRSAIYVRSFGLVNDLDPNDNSENGFIAIAAASYDGPVSVVTYQESVGQSVLMQNAYDIQNIVGQSSNLERVPQDYIQCINTTFDGQTNQGYLITPSAYAQFDAEGRAAVGAAAAAHCESNNFKWMALADAGPFYVTEINKFKNYSPHLPASSLITGNQYLVDNAIYRWTGSSVNYDRVRYQSLVPGSDPKVAVQLSTSSVGIDERIGTLDAATYTLNSQLGYAEAGVFILDSDATWPVSDQIQEVTLSSLGADFEDLLPVGESSTNVYLVAPPYNSAVYGPYPSDGSDQYVFIATTAADAVSILTAVTAMGGTEAVITDGNPPAGAYDVAVPTGSTSVASISAPQWDLPVEINGQTSNLIQNTTGATANVNSLHLPGTLQDSTADYRLSFTSRTIIDPSLVATDSDGKLSFEVISHGLVNGQKLLFTQPITYNSGAVTLVKATTKTGTQPYFVKVVDNDNFLIASSYANYLAGSFVAFPTGETLSSTPTILYTAVTGGGTTAVTLSELTTVPFIRGRKYGFATGTIADEAAVSDSFAPSSDNPTVSIYLNTSSRILGNERIFPYGEDVNAGWLPELTLVSPGSTSNSVENYICTPTVSQSFATEAYLVPAIDAINGGTYDPNAGPATGVLNTAVPYVEAIVVDGSFGTALQSNIAKLVGVYFTVTNNDGKAPDGTTDVVIGDRIAAVSTGTGYEWVVVPAASLGGDLSTVAQVCYGAQVEMAFTQEQTPPTNLWRFDAITSTEIMDAALRGVGFAGEPQAVFVEAGVDNVNRLYEDSQRYFNPFGFIAFYGPYVESASGQFVPPTPYVTGVALRRYRSEGFQFPPAGVKYQLSDAAGVQISVNSAQQNLLNPDGCNVVRSLPGYPSTAVFIWGGRTRINKAVADQRKFQFVNTRVIQNVVYGSLRSAFDNEIFSVIDGFGVVFNQIVSIGNSVLNQLYTAGALYGAQPSDAFQVVCDDRINTSENLENGIVFVKVFDVPVPALERIEIDLIRVSIGQMANELTSQGLGEGLDF